MGFHIKLISLIIGISFMIAVLWMIKKSKLRPSYSLLWICISLFFISIPLFENFYKFIASKIFGFVDATNIIYIGVLGFLMIYIFYLTLKIHRLSDQIHILISSNAILEKEIRDKKK